MKFGKCFLTSPSELVPHFYSIKCPSIYAVGQHLHHDSMQVKDIPVVKTIKAAVCAAVPRAVAGASDFPASGCSMDR